MRGLLALVYVLCLLAWFVGILVGTRDPRWHTFLFVAGLCVIVRALIALLATE